MAHMVRAILFCSHGECTDVFEAYGPIEEIEALACDCGCSLEIIGWPDPVEDAAATAGEGAVELIPLAA